MNGEREKIVLCMKFPWCLLSCSCYY